MWLRPWSSRTGSWRLVSLFGVCVGLCVASSALATEGIGTVTKLDRSVTGALTGRPFPVSLGDDVKEDETVTTDARGEARLTFADDTDLVVFSRSSIKLDRFLLSSPDRACSVVFSTSDGTFAFNIGCSPHEAYRIDTTAGTLKPQGARFFFAVHAGRLKLDVSKAMSCSARAARARPIAWRRALASRCSEAPARRRKLWPVSDRLRIRARCRRSTPRATRRRLRPMEVSGVSKRVKRTSNPMSMA